MIGQMVTPWLGTGPLLEHAADVMWLCDHGVTHVIDTCAEKDTDALVGGVAAYLWNGYIESEEIPEVGWYRRSIAFALTSSGQPRGVIYAHCSAGELRGPTTAYLLLRVTGVSANDALAMIRQARPNALPFTHSDGRKTYVQRYLQGADEVSCAWRGEAP